MAAPPSFNAVVQAAIAQVHALVDIVNTNAINEYNNRKASIIKWNETNPPNLPPAPLPQPPTIYLVNEAAIQAGEQSDAYATFNAASALIAIRYVDPVPPPTVPPSGQIIIDTAHPLAPGVFRTLSGNPHYLSQGYGVTQDGHSYVLEFTIQLGPVWQQVS